jgi:hypothetical protein
MASRIPVGDLNKIFTNVVTVNTCIWQRSFSRFKSTCVNSCLDSFHGSSVKVSVKLCHEEVSSAKLTITS